MPFNRPKKRPEPLTESALYDYAVGALGRKMRTAAELERLLRAKVEPGEEGQGKVQSVMARLREYRFLDDAAFASFYTRLRQENESFGKLRVRRELMRKGVAPDLAANAIETAYGDSNEEELARRHLARKRIARPQNQKEVARVVRRLSAAGFSLAVISKVLRGWKIDIAEEDLVAPEE